MNTYTDDPDPVNVDDGAVDGNDPWHPSEVLNIFANFASRTDDRLKATVGAAFALYLGGHDYAIDDLCERAIARGLDADVVQACLQKAQQRAADRHLGGSEAAPTVVEGELLNGKADIAGLRETARD